MKLKLLFVLTVLLYSSYSFGQIEFQENRVIDNSLYVESPFSVFSADIDGDGDLDVLSASYFDSKVSWFENVDGIGGDFIQHLISSEVQTAISIYAADLDADGDMDVVVASLSGNVVIWFENTDGNGTFVQKQLISAFEVNFVIAKDIDGDNDIDIIWSSSQDGKIKYSKNTDGLGTFSSSIYTIEQNVSSIPNFYTVDIDGDGDIDILSAYSFSGGSEGLTWYRNENGTGSFSSRILISNTLDNITSVYAGDLDGDGDMDVVSASAGDDKIAWFENLDGIGTFSDEQVLSLNADAAAVVRITDIDGDGDLDVISTSNYDGKIMWFENLDGLGNFSGETIITTFIGNMRSLHITDLDGDSNMDFITATDQDNNIKWYENNDGIGNFSPYTITKNIDGGKIIFAADLDGDGDKDILSASHWDDKIAWYENKDGQGDFYNTQIVISENINGAGSVFATDLDGDGDLDVLATSSLDDDVIWFKNTDGLGTFGEPIVIENDLFNVSKALASDIDNDGDMDVFCLARGKIIWYENLDGLGNFGAAIQIESIGNNSIPSIAFGDLDGDNDLDITACYGSGYLYYINLDGQGTFSMSQTLQGYPLQGVSTKINDIDGDGDNDVVVAGEYHGNTTDSSGYVAWFENTDGLGTFGGIQFITTINRNPKSLVVADFDNDGDLDIASSAQSEGGFIAWYENTDGLGDFENTQQIISTSSNSPFDIISADLNNDNNIDLISISNIDDRIVWYTNMGAALSNQIRGTARFDLLGDGCTDEDDLLSGIMVVATNGSGSQAAFTQENGVFRIYMQEEGIVNTQLTAQLPTYYQASPATFQSDFTGFGNADNINFCIEPIGAINDLNISIYPRLNDPRPGFDTAYHLVYKNVGTTQLSGSVTFQFDDSKLQFLSASETVTSQTANTLTFDFADLNPFETRTIDLVVNVFAPPTTNIDDELVSIATINPVTGDETEEDNTFELLQTVIGSYDPNDITVLEGDEIFIEDADKYLHYLIRFQNTGTASAINVNVENILDDKLDWTTMQLESLSHTGRVEITDGNMVNFIFNNINLPDSTTDEPNSHGFIAYKIKPKSNVVLGDTFLNTAAIFFDFNPAIITNTVSTTIVAPLSVVEFDENQLSIYPNPTKNTVLIKATQLIEMVTVYDINGRLLTTNVPKINQSEMEVNLNGLSEGIYFLKVQTNFGTQTQKIIKE
jgi:hypothetical protein